VSSPLPGTGPAFDELTVLQDYLQDLLDHTDASLKPFHVPSTGGFAHRLVPDSGPPSDWSNASTATCVGLLAAMGRLKEQPWASELDTLPEKIISSTWDSAEIGKNNSFAVAFLLEALQDIGEEHLSEEQRKVVDQKVQLLVDAVQEDPCGGVRLHDYEATSFLTYKAVSALERWSRLDDVRKQVERWNWNHFYKECALVAASSPDADVFEVAYSILVASKVAALDAMTPQQRSLLGFGLKQFFAAQRKDGTWPRSRPLFVYPSLGHAYCYDYELLAALLADRQLAPLAREHLGALKHAAEALGERKYPLLASTGHSDPPYGWASGHHGTDPRAESWATAAALHFCFKLDRLVAEAIRRATFRYASAKYEPPKEDAGAPTLGEDLLDSEVVEDSKTGLLKQILARDLLEPLVAARNDVARGKSLPGDPTRASAILYGPPGTSKTELAKLIAKALGWPLLELDPSHLTRRGLDAVYAEADTLFSMLRRCEQVVVLLDEFDELVREREGADQMQSRFLTTAMLPKLTALSKARKVVYLVATNHLEQFDAAIRRPGRFDMVVPVMPPTTAAKRKQWRVLDSALKALDEAACGTAEKQLADLLYLEAGALARRLTADGAKDQLAEDFAQDTDAISQAFKQAYEAATLQQLVDPRDGQQVREQGEASSKSRPEPETWKDRIGSQQNRNRGFSL
jgi:hypothetical protein